MEDSYIVAGMTTKEIIWYLIFNRWKMASKKMAKKLIFVDFHQKKIV